MGRLLSIAIILFWIFMNAALVQRERAFSRLHRYHRGLISYLGNNVERSRWMGIYKDRRRIGSTGFKVERLIDPDPQGVQYVIQHETHLTLDILGYGRNIRILGELEMDREMRPVALRFDLHGEGRTVRLIGKRDPTRRRLVISMGEKGAPILDLPLEESFQLMDGFLPELPISGLRVGERFPVPLFDPLSMEYVLADVTVVGHQTITVDGMPMDTLRVESRYRGLEFVSFINTDGETLRVDTPFGFSLVREEGRGIVRPAFRYPGPSSPATGATEGTQEASPAGAKERKRESIRD